MFANLLPTLNFVLKEKSGETLEDLAKEWSGHALTSPDYGTTELRLILSVVQLLGQNYNERRGREEAAVENTGAAQP